MKNSIEAKELNTLKIKNSLVCLFFWLLMLVGFVRDEVNTLVFVMSTVTALTYVITLIMRKIK